MITMTAEELREFLQRLPLSLSPEEFADWEGCRLKNHAAFNQCRPVLAFILQLVLPGVEIDPADIPWAYTVTQTRAVMSDGGGRIVPLFDMLNHANPPVCTSMCPPHPIPQDALAMLAVQADPAQLRVASAGPGEPAVLTRRGRRLGRLEDCAVVLAPPGGARAGAELRLQYHDTSVRDRRADIQFAVSYGFYPAA